MRQSQLFTKTRKEAPADETSKNAQLLIRGGYINKEMAGVYDFLPLGLRVQDKIIEIIREEMNGVGAFELSMSALQDPEIWKATGRWDDAAVDVWFKTALKSGSEVGLGFTHEEPITRLMRDHISSHKDLPVLAYQFQTKFRNESRAKSGIMRTREFIMKDLYSFARTPEEHEELYEKIASAYSRVFERVGLGDRTYRTFASGGSFSKYSHEYQTVTEAGEDIIYVSKAKKIAVNEEVFNPEVLADLGVAEAELEKTSGSEVGNIFSLGTRFSDALGLSYKNEDEEEKPVIMGCYGIGPARLMGVIVETLADEKGIVWPEAVSPFTMHLVGLNLEDPEVRDYAEGIYMSLKERGVEVLFDDRDLRPGEKFAESDLLGIPYRVVVSRKTKEEGKFEEVKRATGEVEYVGEEELFNDFGSN